MNAHRRIISSVPISDIFAKIRDISGERFLKKKTATVAFAESKFLIRLVASKAEKEILQCFCSVRDGKSGRE